MRTLRPALEAHRQAGRPLRVITTVYTGSTERRALDWLDSIGAEVKVSYDTRTTRLHAKAWLFERLTLAGPVPLGVSIDHVGQSPTGQRYLNHQAKGTHVFLFVRHRKHEAGRTAAYTCLGAADYVSHKRSRPTAITWHLRKPMPDDFFREAKVAAG